MNAVELEHARGRLAGMADWLRGRSYAEQGEDEANDPWHRGYVEGWGIGGAEDFEAELPSPPSERAMTLRSQAEADRACERVGWRTIHKNRKDQS